MMIKTHTNAPCVKLKFTATGKVFLCALNISTQYRDRFKTWTGFHYQRVTYRDRLKTWTGFHYQRVTLRVNPNTYPNPNNCCPNF